MAGNEFVEGWLLGQTLGEGAYGEVKLVVNNSTGEAVAMKIIDLRKHSDASLLVKKETAIQRSLKHPHLLQYFGKRSHGHFEYIFLEYCSGGELFDRIEPDVGMAVDDARRYFLQILSGVEYLHSRGVAHRDLKPENILLDDNDNIKISDFGMATMFRLKGVERRLERRCGTLPYVAPEVLVGPYSAIPADIWSCGIILVAMLVGELPWDQPSRQCEEYVMWCDGCVAGCGAWRTMGATLLTLLRKVLHPEPDKRPPVSSIRQHTWLSNENDGQWLLLHQVLGDSEWLSYLRALLYLLQWHTYTTTPSATQHLHMVMSVLWQFSSFDALTVSGSTNFEVCLSQPLPTGTYASTLMEKTIGKPSLVDDQLFFSQPTVSDDLLLATQMNATQCSQSVFQQCVRRMTRFSVGCDMEKAMSRLVTFLKSTQCQWKTSQGNVITVTTLDSRKMNLVFKASFIGMSDEILVDFRLSKGCGLEFKRRFLRIKNNLSDIIVK